MTNSSDDQMKETQTPTGPKIISSFVKNLPSTPGVYRMFDLNGHVIYVGKARNLKARVSNYTSYENNPVRTCRMISATANMEFVHTNTEAEALLLEAN
ncbi:Excinuclease ABC subunit C, partial [hydrothermal vent metagenome]